MVITSANGFVNFTLRLENLQPQPDGTQTILARGDHQGKALGLCIRLSREWEKDTFAGQVTWRGVLSLESIGDESDAFLAAAGELYGEPRSGARMAASTAFTASSLAGDPHRIEQGKVKLKLVHEPETDAVDENAIDAIYEEQYAEIYLNLDAAAGQIEFNEKDSSYRMPLLTILSKLA